MYVSPKASLVLLCSLWCEFCATWVGRWAAHSTKNNESTNRKFLQPPSDAQLVLAALVNQLWSEWKTASSDFPSFTDTVSHSSYRCQYISSLWFHAHSDTWHYHYNKVLVTESQMYFWQMYNATCLLFSMCLSFVLDPRGERSETKVRPSWLHGEIFFQSFVFFSSFQITAAAPLVHVCIILILYHAGCHL